MKLWLPIKGQCQNAIKIGQFQILITFDQFLIKINNFQPFLSKKSIKRLKMVEINQKRQIQLNFLINFVFYKLFQLRRLHFQSFFDQF